MRVIAAILTAGLLAACNQTTTNVEAGPAPPMPNIKTLILANKGKIYKDPESIKNASLDEPRYANGQWVVCIMANAKNSFGGYIGEKPLVVSFQGNELGLVTDPTEYGAKECRGPMKPFPELNGRRSEGKRS